MISLRHAAKRGCRQLSSRRTYATSRQKRALNEQQLGGKNAPEGTSKAGKDAPPAPPTPPVESSSSSSLPVILALVAAGGAGAYYMDLIPGMSSGTDPVPPKEVKALKEESSPVPAVTKETKKETPPKPVEVVQSKVKEGKDASASPPKQPETTSFEGNRVLNISLPPGSKKSAPPAGIMDHPVGGNKVSMEPRKEEEPSSTPKENTPSVDAALQELKKQISKDDSTRSLLEAHKDVAKLTSMDLSDLDQMTITQLKIRLVQMAKDMEERTKWEAVRLKEFLAMKEKEVEDKYILLLKKQEREAENLLDEKLTKQEKILVQQTAETLQEKEEAMQGIIENSLKIQEKSFEDEKASFEKMTEEKINAKYEEMFGNSLAQAKNEFAKKMEQRVQQITSLKNKLSDLEFALQSSKAYKSDSLQAHRMSAAAMALIDKLESSKPAAAAVEALKSVSETNAVVNAAISALPKSVASSGVATLQELQTQFEEQVHPKCRQAAMIPEGQKGLEGQLLGMLFATLKFAPGPEDTAPESEKDAAEYVLARARRHVQLGELEQAVFQMDKLKGQPSFTASDWQQSAKDRLAVEKALKVIRMECALANEAMSKAN